MDFNEILKGVQKAGENIDKQLKQIGKDIDNQKRKILMSLFKMKKWNKMR